MKQNKHFYNALVYDIFNWAFNISAAVFVWTLSHFWAILLCGLLTFRFAADLVFKRALLKDQKELQQKLYAQFQKMQEAQPQPLAQVDQENLIVEDVSFLEEEIIPHNINSTEDKKVH